MGAYMTAPNLIRSGKGVRLVIRFLDLSAPYCRAFFFPFFFGVSLEPPMTRIMKRENKREKEKKTSQIIPQV